MNRISQSDVKTLHDNGILKTFNMIGKMGKDVDNEEAFGFVKKENDFIKYHSQKCCDMNYNKTSNFISNDKTYIVTFFDFDKTRNGIIVYFT